MLIEQAFAQDAVGAAAGSGAGMLMSYLPILLIFGIFYILIIRPQNAAAKAHTALIAALKKDDVVLTDGGLIGEISNVADNIVHVRLADGVKVALNRSAVRRVLNAEEAKGWEPKASKK